MSFLEQAYLEIKTIDPSITATEFSTKWLNKCSSYYRSYKARNRDMTLHALMCFLNNLDEKSSSLRMNNQSFFCMSGHLNMKTYLLSAGNS